MIEDKVYSTNIKGVTQIVLTKNPIVNISKMGTY